MPASYTPLLGLVLPVQGEETNQWGNLVNTALTSLVDTAVAGTTTLSSDANVTLTSSTGIADQARSATLLFSGARTAIRTVTAPARSKVYVLLNQTTGGFAVQFVGAGPTTGVTVPNGAGLLVAWNGSDFQVISSVPINLATQVTGTLPVANGGTGLTSGTSGGALYYSAAGTLASSAVLAANALVIGGGAGVAPSTTTTGAGVVTALGVAANAAAGFPTGSGTATLTNKRISPRVNVSTTTTSPWAWNSDSYDQQEFTDLANALTINADAGTPTDGQKNIFRIQDNGTGRILTFTGGVSKGFRPIGVNTTVSGSDFTYTTIASRTTYFGCIYNSGDARWDIVAIGQEV